MRLKPKLERNRRMEQKIKLTESAILDLTKEAPFISFPALSELGFVKHGFSTRLGGVSTGMFASMNLGFGRGDSEENVRENYRRFMGSIGIQPNNLVISDQVHETMVRKVGAKDCGKGYCYPKDYQGVDGHITKEAGVAVLVYTADCVPLFFADKRNHAVGIAHSGWRGTVSKIAAITVKRMEEEYQTNPEDLVVVIGPSIGPECYEVSKDVAEQFQKAYSKEEIQKILTPCLKEEKYLVDLWSANRFALLEVGVKKENIICSKLCTMCHSDLFFTHRGSGGKRGSLAGVIQIKEEI